MQARLKQRSEYTFKGGAPIPPRIWFAMIISPIPHRMGLAPLPREYGLFMAQISVPLGPSRGHPFLY